MKYTTKRIWRIVISILYILWGLLSPIAVFDALLDLDPIALAAAGVNLLMLIAGIFGLIGIKKIKCRIFGVIILVCQIAVLLGGVNISSVISVILALLFIICV